MSFIHYDESNKVFTIQTKASTYQLCVGPCNYLCHLYYGKKIERTAILDNIQLIDRGFSGNPYEAELDRRISPDTLPLEYPCYGLGDFRSAALQVCNADGSRACVLKYVSHKISAGKPKLEGLPAIYGDEAETLEILLEDPVTHIQVTLLYSVMYEFDAIARAAIIKNVSDKTVYLEKALSATIELYDDQHEMFVFHGKHCQERHLQRVPLHHGRIVLDSNRGTSSHQMNPCTVFCDPTTTETYGECFELQLVYSGNFSIEAEVDQINKTRVNIGINPVGFRWQLEAGAHFTTPEAVLSYSGNGFGQLTRNMHKLYRDHLCRGNFKNARRPILINNWEATYFNFNEEKLFNIAQEAQKLGIEMLVMDDGWFGKRENDDSGLGDWVVNEKKLKGGLAALTKRITDIGMKFGIWVELEMVSEDSDLYRAHPDWAIHIEGRQPIRSRYQLVLDMTRQDVRDYLFKSISDILNSGNIAYVKWDMNRHISDVWSAKLPAERMGEFLHRYVLGLYDLLEKILTAFPNILFEGCSGGGGRFDAGMLYYYVQSWLSDDTDAIERLKIQYGSSFLYPISSMGSHVSAVPNHQTGRLTPLSTRGIVAMAGTFGYELDISKMTDEEKATVKEQVAAFKQYYELIQRGDYYRLTNPYVDEVTSWLFVSEDKKEALLNAVQQHCEPNPRYMRVKLQGLDESKDYKIDGKVYSGSALMNYGFVLPIVNGDYQGFQYHITAV